jgi:hypothetical protein
MSIFACLSPNEIWLSEQVGWYAITFCVAVTIALVALTVQQRNYAWLPIYGTLLVLHPAWTVSVMSGDCGLGRRFDAGVFCLLFLAVLLFHIFWPQFSRRRFVNWCCFVFWIAWLVCRTYSALPVPHLLPIGGGEFTFYGELCDTLVIAWRDLFSLALLFSLVSFIWWLIARIRKRFTAAKVMASA